MAEPTDDRPGRGFWIGLALGTPVMIYGAYELVQQVGWPALRGYGVRPDNATVHPLDYGSAVLTALALLWGAVVLWSGLAFLRRARVRPTA